MESPAGRFSTSSPPRVRRTMWGRIPFSTRAGIKILQWPRALDGRDGRPFQEIFQIVIMGLHPTAQQVSANMQAIEASRQGVYTKVWTHPRCPPAFELTP